MGRVGRAHAKILRCLYQSNSKISLPDAVHEHTCSGGRFSINQPLCESETAVVCVRWQRVQERRHSGGDLFGGFEPIAALKHKGLAFFIARASSFARSEGKSWRSLGPLLA